MLKLLVLGAAVYLLCTNPQVRSYTSNVLRTGADFLDQQEQPKKTLGNRIDALLGQ